MLTGAKSWQPPQPPAARTARCPPEGRGPRGPRPQQPRPPRSCSTKPASESQGAAATLGLLPLARRRVHGGHRTLPPTDAGVRSGSGLSDPGERDTEPPLARSRGTLRTFPDLSGEGRAGTAEGRDKRAAGRTGPRVGTDTQELPHALGRPSPRPAGARPLVLQVGERGGPPRPHTWATSPGARGTKTLPSTRAGARRAVQGHGGRGRAQGSDPSSAATA